MDGSREIHNRQIEKAQCENHNPLRQPQLRDRFGTPLAYTPPDAAVVNFRRRGTPNANEDAGCKIFANFTFHIQQTSYEITYIPFHK